MNKETLLERGMKVDANIGVDEGNDCWISAIVIAVHSHTATVRDANSDDEWTLPFGKIVISKPN